MPVLNPIPRYQVLDPYIHTVDNLPIDVIAEQITTVNTQTDLNNATLMAAAGDQGSIANRLNQSIEDSGAIKTEAIDNALHSIAEHLDGGGYVRMTTSERSKLSLIASEATNLRANISTISGIIPYVNAILNIGGSDSITWRYNGDDDVIVADTNFPAAVRHLHYYTMAPITTDYKNYTVTSVATAYKQNSLRVYVNGVRLNQSYSVYVPFGLPSSLSWTALKFAEGTATSGIVTGGDFALSATISSTAIVVVDFDTAV